MSQKLKHNKLIGYRKMFGLNQTDIAKILDIGTNTYSFKENNKTEFTISESIKITKYLKEFKPEITMDEIFL